MLTCLLGLLIRSQPDPALPIEYANEGATFAVIGKELEEQTGWVFEVKDDARNELLVLRATGQTAGEVFGQIEKVSYTKWEFKDDRVLISLDHSRREKDVLANEAEGSDQYWEFWQNAIAENRARVADPEIPEDVDIARCDRFLAQLMGDISRAEFNKALRARRAVFSTNPNSMQQLLRVRNRNDLNWLIESANKYLREIQLDEDYADDRASNELWGIPTTQSFSQSTHKLQVVVEFSEYDSLVAQVSVTLQLTDTQGTASRMTGDFIDLGSEIDEMESESEEAAPEIVSTWPKDILSQKIQRSDLGTEWNDMERHHMSPAYTIPKSIYSAIKNPTVNEPVKFNLGQPLTQLSNAINKPLIAWFSDKSVWAGEIGNDVPIEVVLKYLGLLEYPLDEKEWIEVGPQQFSRRDSLRLDRKLIKQYFSTYADDYSMPIDAAADYAYYCFDPMYSNWFDYPWFLSFPSWLRQMGDNENQPTALLIYGGLSRDQRERLWRGERIYAKELSRSSVLAIIDILSSTEMNLHRLDLSSNSNWLYRSEIDGYQYTGEIPQSTESTEVLERFSAFGFIQANVQEGKYAVRALNDNSGITSFFLDRQDLASLINAVANRDPSKQRRPAQTSYRLGEYRQMGMMIHLGDGMGVQYSMFDFKKPDMYNAYFASSFPDEIVSTARRDYEEDRNRVLNKFDEDD